MMIKLKEILEDKNPIKGKGLYNKAYHVAEKDVRNSIEKYGLDSDKYQLNDRTTSGKFIYVFVDYNDAEGYVDSYNSWLVYQGEPKRSFDIWQIDTKNLDFLKDYTLNTGDPEYDSAYTLKSPVDKRLLKLVDTIE